MQRLDTDDFSAEIAQQHRGEGASPHDGEVENSKAVERKPGHVNLGKGKARIMIGEAFFSVKALYSGSHMLLNQHRKSAS